MPIANGAVVWTGAEMIVWGGRPATGGRTNSGSRYNPATDTWTPTSTVGAPRQRSGHTAVWTGSEMVVWGGCSQLSSHCSLGDGGRYNPLTDTWTPTATIGGRTGHTAVWTGSRMIIWGGCSPGYNNACNTNLLHNTGFVYDPSANTWSPITTTNAPSARSGHKAVWTGAEMLIWGGSLTNNTGGRYNLASNTWTAINTFNAPNARVGASAVWTGAEFIYWGGYEGNFVTLNTGGRYNPSTDTWTPTSQTNAPAPRFGHSAVWTGSEMIVFGGDLRIDNTYTSNTGGRYNPSNNSWTPTSTAGAPSKANQLAVWTGTEMIAWGGTTVTGQLLKDGGRYNPASDSWTPTSTGDSVPSADLGVWSGAEMIVWGRDPGCISGCPSIGGRYNPATNAWRAMNTTNAPPPNSYAPSNTAVWTGSEMIVWGAGGGDGEPGQGGRYNPLTDTWTPTSTTNAPTARNYHTAVWTGAEMIVWGGLGGPDTGGRYNPSTDTWTLTSTANAPSGRYLHTAVWTGSEMIVWGGVEFGGPSLNTGGRYNPSTDTWTPTSTASAPTARTNHTAIWSGSEMVVWGGRFDATTSNAHLNTGARYNPLTNMWTPTSTIGAPLARQNHRAVWTGSQMLIWGGAVDGVVGPVGTYTGARYQPASDVWVSMNTARAPSKRSNHVQVWTGSQMIVWGGTADEGAATHGAVYNAPGASAAGNSLPTIRLTAPTGGAVYQSGDNVTINAETADSDGVVTAVRFYAGETLIGTDTEAPFSFTWNEVRGGTHTLTATAADDMGGATRSSAVEISVTPSEAPPVCVLASPLDGASYTTPADLPVAADARANRDRTLAKVEFFDGTRAIGVYTAGPYGYTWTNAPAGTYNFFVRCTDNAGAVTTSPVSVVTVQASNAVSISGNLKDDGGFNIIGVSVRLNTSQSATERFATTDLSGNFYFSNLPSGADYTVTPADAAWNFTPAERFYPALTQLISNSNFNGRRAGFGISGRLTDPNGQPIYPAIVSLSGSRSVTGGTDVNGNYFFSNLTPGGDYHVMPYKNEYNFSPAYQTFNNLSAQQTADFVGAAKGTPLNIGGRIVGDNGAGVEGIRVRLDVSEGTTPVYATTGANGDFQFANMPSGADYLVVPEDDSGDYNFLPAHHSYSELVQHLSTANFTAVGQTATGVDTVWFDDSLPTGAQPYANGDTWSWVSSSPTPFSGSSAHQSAVVSGIHNHFFQSASQTLPLAAGDKLFTYVYLDPANQPSELMLQWSDGSQWSNAYWGSDTINWVNPRLRVGDLPPAGQWVRLEVSASALGLEGRSLSGMSFVLAGGRATFDQTGKTTTQTTPPPSSSERVWVEDAIPTGGIPAGSEPWTWVSANPPPHSGTQAHQSALAAGIHHHYFHAATATLQVNSGDKLFAYVYLDAQNPPSELMLQWHDGFQWKNAYWGADLIPQVGERVHMGALPAAGAWVRLEVPAAAVGLEGKSLTGMSFVLSGGRATWDRAGALTVGQTGGDVVWVEDAIPAGGVAAGSEPWTWGSTNPAPFSGTQHHRSAVAAGIHHHYFQSATATLSVGSGEKLFAYIFIDAASPPAEVMLQWFDGTQWRNAYWGADLIPQVGERFNAGALPAAGQWVRLEVPAAAVELENRTLTGMSFVLHGGSAMWDKAGKTQ